MNLECKVSLREGTQELLTEIGEIIKPRVGKYLNEKGAIRLMEEIAKEIVNQNTEVSGPFYVDSNTHEIATTKLEDHNFPSFYNANSV